MVCSLTARDLQIFEMVYLFDDLGVDLYLIDFYITNHLVFTVLMNMLSSVLVLKERSSLWRLPSESAIRVGFVSSCSEETFYYFNHYHIKYQRAE